MKKRPSYDELEEKIKELEKECAGIKRIQAALRKSEEKYRIAVENSLAGIYIIRGGRFQYVNPRFLEITGYSHVDEILGRPFWELVHPEDRPLVKRRGLARERTEVHPTRYTFRALKKDGSTIWVDIGGTHATYMGKAANVGNLLDITELKLAEEALRASEERYRTIVETIQDGYYEVDLHGNLTFCNKSAYEIVGCAEDELIGRNYVQFADPDTAEEVYRAFNEVFRTGKPAPAIRWEVIRKDGGKRCIELSVSLIRSVTGRKIGFQGIGRDITRRKLIEDELRNHRQHLEELVEERTALLERVNEQLLLEIVERKRTEERLTREKDFTDAVINSLPGVFYIVDIEGNIVRWNKTLETVSGYMSEEISVMKELDFFPREDFELVARKHQEVFIRGEGVMEANLASSNSNSIPYFFTGVRAKLDDQAYLVGLGVDISERKRAEEALAQSEKQLRSLSAQLLTTQEKERKRVARELHDGIGQTLTAHKVKLESTLTQVRDGMFVNLDESLEALISMIKYSIEEVRRISADLRPSILDDLGILPTILWFCRQFQGVYSDIHIEKDIALTETDVPEHLKTIIFRVLQEALNNIAKHSKADSARLCLRNRRGRIELVIQDNGSGFDLKSALASASYTKGLGLASMKERTELSRGSFTIRSAKGKGTIIRASWPKTGS